MLPGLDPRRHPARSGRVRAWADRDGAIVEQAQRLLDDPRADTTLARFFREWTAARPISSADKSTEVFPDFDAALAASMNESFDRFTVGIVREGGSLDDLLRRNEAWVDARMAALLGVAAPAGDGWSRVTLDAGLHRGMLTQPALLAALAHSDRTSYVFRGAFVRAWRDLAAPPPAGAMGVDVDVLPDPTAKQESEARIRAVTAAAATR
ncbi:MAG: DUF1592 domain-containing protein [Nannocystaceae bacterium]